MATILNSRLADLFDQILDWDHPLHMAVQKTPPYSTERAAAVTAIDRNRLVELQSAAVGEARSRGAGDTVHVIPMIMSLVNAFEGLLTLSVGKPFNSTELIAARTQFLATWNALNPYVPRGDSSQETTQSAGVNIEAEIERFALAMGDEVWRKIMIIAERKDISGENKMKAIGALDQRCKSWKSTQWSTLLKVSDAAVRGYDTWEDWAELR